MVERKWQKPDSVMATIDRAQLRLLLLTQPCSFVYSSPHRRLASVFWECDLLVLNEEHQQHVYSR